MSKKALIVVDMVNDFVDGALPVGEPAKKIVPFIMEKIKEFHKNGDIVVFACDSHKDGIDGNWPKHCDPDTDGAKLYGEIGEWYVANSGDMWIEEKETYDSFHNTGLTQWLRASDVEEVYVVGVCTDICIYSTVAGAYFNGFKVNVFKDGCATLEVFKDREPQVYQMMKDYFFANII